ncbi:MAG: ArsR/SmtB family transcription factor [Vicinamibacteraceae bacterium]
MSRAATSSDVFNAIAEPQRRAILEVLAGDERSVNEVVHVLGVAQPSISKHLRVLREVGLVHSRRDGRQIWYRTNAHGIRPLYEWAGTFERFWSQRLRRIKERAESTQHAVRQDDIQPRKSQNSNARRFRDSSQAQD